MSFFKFDETNASSGFEMVAEGKYEVVIVNAVAGTVQSNKQPKITVDFEIRSDVNQNHQGAKILYNDYKFDNEVAVRITNSLLKACGFANNHTFTSPDDMAKQLFNKHLEITVKHEPSYKDPSKVYAKAKYHDVSKAAAPITPGAPITVSDDDVPF